METWYFTFGLDSKHKHKYIKINGSCHDTLLKMLRNFGNDWSTQYSEHDFMFRKIAEKWQLTELEVKLL